MVELMECQVLRAGICISNASQVCCVASHSHAATQLDNHSDHAHHCREAEIDVEDLHIKLAI